MEGHAAMDMSVQRDGSFGARLFSGEGSTSGAHIYVMQWAAVIRDIGIGLLIVGAVAALGPRLLLAVAVPHRPPRPAQGLGTPDRAGHRDLELVCSIGNVPLAGVLYNGGISFDGVISFMFADLITIPILLIYRKYYGTKMTRVPLGVDHGRRRVRRRGHLQCSRSGEGPRPGPDG